MTVGDTTVTLRHEQVTFAGEALVKSYLESAAARPGGTVAFNGEQPGLELSPSEDFIRRDIGAFGSWFYHFGEFGEMLELYRRGLPVEHLGHTGGVRDDLGVDPGLSHPPCDQLRVLGSVVDDEDEVVRGHWRSVGSPSPATLTRLRVVARYSLDELSSYAQLPPRSTIWLHINLPLYSPRDPSSGRNPG